MVQTENDVVVVDDVELHTCPEIQCLGEDRRMPWDHDDDDDDDFGYGATMSWDGTNGIS